MCTVRQLWWPSSSPRRGWGGAWIVLTFLACMLLLTSVPFATFATCAACPQEVGDAEERKLKLKLKSVLQDDPEIRPYHLFVDVKRNVATLAGDVPNETVARRAVELAGRILGISEVCNQLRIVPEALAAPRGPGEKTPTIAELTRRPRDYPVVEEGDGPGSVVPPGAGKPQSLGGAVTLGIPTPLARETPRAPTPPVAQPVAPPTNLATTVEGIRRSEDRFRGLSVSLREQDLVVQGTVVLWEDVEAFAQRARRLSGIRRVLLDNIQVASQNRGTGR